MLNLGFICGLVVLWADGVYPGQDIQMHHFTPLFQEDARQRGSEQAQAIVLFYTVAVKR